MSETQVDLNKQFSKSKHDDPKLAIVIAPYTGKIKHHTRLRRLLNRNGYDVLLFDYGKEVLESGDASLLPELVQQIKNHAEEIIKRNSNYQGKGMLIGSSLGALIALNILRSSSQFNKAILITGGDIAKVAQKFYPHVWKRSYAQLADDWSEVNMYTRTEDLEGKKALMVIAKRDRIADPSDVIKEAQKHHMYGNDFILLTKKGLGHGKRVIYETMLYPRYILKYIAKLD